MKSILPQTNDSDSADDPDIYDTNNHAETNESVIKDSGHIEPNAVKDLGDLNTGPAQPILSVSLNNISYLILCSYLVFYC